MELKVGMYVRTHNGIYKIYREFHEESVDVGIGILPEINGFYIDKEEVNYIEKKEITKASYNIIDLIEVGDYVNGYQVSFKGKDIEPFVQCDYPVQEGTTNHYRFYEQAIYTILTKEQFENNVYRIGD